MLPDRPIAGIPNTVGLEGLAQDEVDRQRASELAAQYEEHRQSAIQLQAAQRVGMRTAFVCQVALNIGTLLAIPEVLAALTQPLVALAIVLVNLAFLGWVTAPIGLISARIAYECFRRSTISVNKMTIVITLIFGFVVIGWIIVLVGAMSQH